MTESGPLKEALFKELDVNEGATEMESLCVNCGQNGSTRLLLTKIPFYREVIIISFSCPHCGFENNELQPGGKVEEKGVSYTLTVKETRDLNRQIVKSDFTSVKIPLLDLEIPSQSQKGEVTTVEGVLDRVARGLQQEQPIRRATCPEDADKIDNFIARLNRLKEIPEPFVIELRDISGQSFVELRRLPKDPQVEKRQFRRTKEEDEALGIYEEAEGSGLLTHQGDNWTFENLQSEVLKFPTNCPQCGAPCDTNMKVTDIPYFKQVVLMATICEVCGVKTNEVKSAAGIEELGLKIEVSVTSPQDFTRDILKSETCHICIPELELEMGPTTLGGKFSTVEGLLVQVKEQLAKESCIFSDSLESEKKTLFEDFLAKFEAVLKGEVPVTLILDDPAGNSYVQSLEKDGEPDEKIKITRYERTFEQNDELGLNDMKTENNQEDT